MELLRSQILLWPQTVALFVGENSRKRERQPQVSARLPTMWRPFLALIERFPRWADEFVHSMYIV